MGLDQTWLVRDNADSAAEELHYHRKVPALEAFMAKKWADQGNDDVFNCETLEVTEELLDELSEAVDNEILDKDASGFFWGSYRPEDDDDIRTAIRKAREALAEDKEVAYISSW